MKEAVEQQAERDGMSLAAVGPELQGVIRAPAGAGLDQDDCLAAIVAGCFGPIPFDLALR